MIRFIDRFAPRIWTRLFLLVIATVLSTWVVVAIAFYWLGTARKVVGDLGRNQVPRLIHTSELSAKATDLAIFSNRLLYTQGAETRELEEALRGSIAELDALMGFQFSTQLTRRDAAALQDQLAAVINMLDTVKKIEKRLRQNVEQLRWLNIDVQDETAALVADYSYNIKSLTQNLTFENSAAKRKEIAQKLLEEQNLHSSFLALGNEAAVAITLAVQMFTSQSATYANQLDGLLNDALDRVDIRISHLPDKPEYLALRQSAHALQNLITGPNGALADQKERQEAQSRLNEYLNSAFVQLSDMQSKLKDQAARNTQAFNKTSADFTTNSTLTMQLLLAMTIFAATAGIAIMFLYIRPSIIRPMQVLTTAMRQIVEGNPPQLGEISNRDDEISGLAQAVNVFHSAVHERDQAIETLRRTQSDLVQAGKMAALGTLSAGISHELNQPLGAIRQRLHMADKAITNDDLMMVGKQTEKINALVKRMERIIDHLRRFARRSDYKTELVLLPPLIDDACELLASKITEHKVALETGENLSEVQFLADPVLIEQVLVNLLSNSIDAIGETGVPGKIVIQAESADKKNASFSVIDNGIGLGTLSPKQAMDPFVTTKDPGQGLGLGLSISFNIITGMGGSMKLLRRKRRGTCVMITLPKPQP